MIIECQSGALLESRHVVEWDVGTTSEGDEQNGQEPALQEPSHIVSAHTVLDTTIEVFRGEASDCAVRLGEIRESLNGEYTMLRHLCEGFTTRDDTLSKSIKRITHAIRRLMDRQ